MYSSKFQLDIAGERVRATQLRELQRRHGLSDADFVRWLDAGLTLEQAAVDALSAVGNRAHVDTLRRHAGIGLSDSATRKFSLTRVINAIANGQPKSAGLELEVSRECARRHNRQVDEDKSFLIPADVLVRDLTAATGSAGGYLVQTSNVSFIDLLRNRSVAFNMGARRLSGLQGNVTVPRHSTAATAYWLTNEATQITESNQVFGQMSLSPKNVGAYTELSRQLTLQSSPDAESLVMSDLAEVVALAVDTAALNGSGASGQPTGLINTAGIGSVTGTSIDYAKVLEFQTDVATGNALSPNCGYVTTPAVASLLAQRQRFSGTYSPLWEGPISEGRIVGFRSMSSNQVPTANMIFGDWSQLVIAEWGVLQIDVNPFANFQAGIIGVRALYSVDIGVRTAAAFSLATSIT